jgi:hypothetical protein
VEFVRTSFLWVTGCPVPFGLCLRNGCDVGRFGRCWAQGPAIDFCSSGGESLPRPLPSSRDSSPRPLPNSQEPSSREPSSRDSSPRPLPSSRDSSPRPLPSSRVPSSRDSLRCPVPPLRTDRLRSLVYSRRSANVS